MTLSSNKIGFVIQARMQSERLPGKVLLPMPVGSAETMLGRIVSQLKKSSHPATIVVATGNGSANDPIALWSESHGVLCFRGDEKDVLSRYISVTRENEFETVVRLTADNPLIDLTVLDQVIDAHVKSDADYTSSSGMPLGMNVEVVHGPSLIELEHRELNDADREHVTHHFRNNPGFSVHVVHIARANELSAIRTTVDYPEDYVFMSAVLAHKTATDSGLNALGRFAQEFPYLLDVNRKNLQKKQFDNAKVELQEAAIMLEQADMHRAAQALRDALTAGHIGATYD
jgi:spore coat polysaccharide biosynthesis protein SpsF